MADSTISGLTAASALTGTEKFAIADGTAVSKAATAAQIATFAQTPSATLAPDCEFYTQLTATYTLTSQTGAQKLFNTSTNGALTVAGSKTYLFECFFALTTMSASSGSFGFAFGGTATLTGQEWMAIAAKAAAATASTGQITFNTAANITLVTANTTTTGEAFIKGKIRINAAGTIIPQVSLGVAAAAVVAVGSYFRCWPVGSDAVTTVGSWS